MRDTDDIGTKKDLVLYRLESAAENIDIAQYLFEKNYYKAANNRAYYAIFYAVNAVHALNNISYRRHKDAIANFNREYVKTEIFPRSIGKKISRASIIRHASDYDDFYIASREETEIQISNAKEFVEIVKIYCNQKIQEM